jgi:hypothetical protein
VEAFVLAFDSTYRPVVGQQITLSSSNGGTVGPRIDLFLQRDTAGDCNLVAKGTVSGEARGWYRTAVGDFQGDRVADAPLTDAALRALSASTDLTYTCVPPGSGYRIGVDRDRDGTLDGDELNASTDPADPVSNPPGAVHCLASLTIERPTLRLTKVLNPAGDERISAGGRLTLATNAAPLDPVVHGLRFKVLDANGVELFARVIPPGASPGSGLPGWSVNRSGTRWRFKDGAGTLAGGVTTVVVADKTARTPGLYQFRISGKEDDFQATAVESPLQLVVVLGDGAQTAADECGAIAFNPETMPVPNCKVSGSQDTIRCRY